MRSASAAALTVMLLITCMYVGESAWVSITARVPPDRPAYRRCSSGATASPLGGAATSIEPANRGWAAEMSIVCTLLLVRSARYRRCAVWSASTPSKEPAAIAGTAAWRTVDWQPAQAPRSRTPPAAATTGIKADMTRAASAPRRFIQPKRAAAQKYERPVRGAGG